VPRSDPDPQALACYGLLVQERPPQGVSQEQGWRRFVADRPGSAVRVAFLTWVCPQVTAGGKTALLLVWENAAWQGSQAVRQWSGEHTQRGKREGQGSRSVTCPLPRQSPWLNPLEAHWGQGKRAVVDPPRLLTAAELVERGNAHFGCPHQQPLSIPQKVS
jgi:hypothetical protein